MKSRIPRLLLLATILLAISHPFLCLAKTVMTARELSVKLAELAVSGKRPTPAEIARDAGFAGELQQLGGIERYFLGDDSYPVDLGWVAVAWKEMQGMTDGRRQALAVEAILDCLAGLARSFDARQPAAGLTPAQMREALLRAHEKGRRVEAVLPAEVAPGRSLKGCRGMVCEAFEGDVIAARVTGGSGSRGSPGGGFAGGESPPGGNTGGGSGSSSGNGSGGGSGSSSGSGFSSGSSSGSTSGAGSTSAGGTSGSAGSPGSQGSVTVYGSQGGSVSPPPFTSRPPQSQIMTPPPRQTPPPPQAQPPRPPPPPPPPPAPKPPEPPKPPDQGPKGGAKLLFWMIVILLALLFIGLVIYIFLTFRKNLQKPPPVAIVGTMPVREEQVETPTLFQEAVAAAEKGQFERAIRLMTLASMLLLDEARVLVFDKRLTNGEYLDELRRHAAQDVSGLWQEPLRRFDRLIYGFSKASRQDFDVFKTLYLNLEDRKKR